MGAGTRSLTPIDRAQTRRTLIAAREAVTAADRRLSSEAIIGHLAQLIDRYPPGIASLYWPIRGEPDVTPLRRHLEGLGWRVALPVTEALDRPLAFHLWLDGSPLEPGFGGILEPAGTARVRPTLILLPVAGFDAAGYRLGYGAGLFDRTLAALEPKPVTIGVGFELSRLPTIEPAPHDIPMDWIVTERGVAAGATRRDNASGDDFTRI